MANDRQESGKHRNPVDILYDLVAVQSDTGTAREATIAAAMLEMIREHPYFAARPDMYGRYDGGDPLGRPVVWALRRGSGSATVLLTGHYDAVDLEPYGPFKRFALDPDLLRSEMGRQHDSYPFPAAVARDLDNPDWIFGRGTADMKAGLAIALWTLFTVETRATNVLFVAVSDEENLSAGARQAVPLLSELRERFDLDYALGVLSEPQYRNPDVNEAYVLHRGSMGKVLPFVVAKGILTHAAEIFSGLNSALIVSEIVRRTELATEFVSEDQGTSTPPPTTLLFRDLKSGYDVSVPEYSAASFNVQFLNGTTPLGVIERLRELGEQALGAALQRYDESFDAAVQRGAVSGAHGLQASGEALTLAELEARLERTVPDYASVRSSIEEEVRTAVRDSNVSLQEASIRYVQRLIEASGIGDPLVVVGIAPPYYPAVSERLEDGPVRAVIDALPDFTRRRFGTGTEERPYLFAMTDMSYLCSHDAEGDREILANLAIPDDLYEVPIDDIAELAVPTLIIGPACRSPHQIYERVYLPDVAERMPAIFRRIVERVEELG